MRAPLRNSGSLRSLGPVTSVGRWKRPAFASYFARSRFRIQNRGRRVHRPPGACELRRLPMCFLALFPNGIERQIGRQSLRIHDTVQDGRFARTERTLKGGRKVLSAHNTLAVSPKVSSKRREVGISQARCRDPPWIVTFLMHADCTVHAVVEHHHNNGNIVLDGSGEFLSVHQEIAIAGKCYNHSIWKLALCQHGRRRSIPHGSASWCELSAE